MDGFIDLSLYNPLKNFLSNSLRNQWLTFDHMEIYVRKSWRNYWHIRTDLRHPTCLDIASVKVEESFQHTGIFKEFLKHAEAINTLPLIMVENVYNPVLPEFLKSVGYTEFDSISYVKFNDHCKEYDDWQAVIESLKK